MPTAYHRINKIVRKTVLQDAIDSNLLAPIDHHDVADAFAFCFGKYYTHGCAAIATRWRCQSVRRQT